MFGAEPLWTPNFTLQKQFKVITPERAPYDNDDITVVEFHNKLFQFLTFIYCFWKNKCLWWAQSPLGDSTKITGPFVLSLQSADSKNPFIGQRLIIFGAEFISTAQLGVIGTSGFQRHKSTLLFWFVRLCTITMEFQPSFRRNSSLNLFAVQQKWLKVSATYQKWPDSCKFGVLKQAIRAKWDGGAYTAD